MQPVATVPKRFGTEPLSAYAPGAVERGLGILTAAFCIGLLCYKFLLAFRLNVNWDEFFFLNHVYALARGELTILMQGAYTHLFLWLPAVGGNEMTQVCAGRMVMVGLLSVTTVLLWRLARVWLCGFPALIAPFVYLSARPVLVHGGSFRADSLLAPLSVAALLLVTRSDTDQRRDWYAGLLLGLAFVATVKVVLFAPLVAAIVVFRERDAAVPGSSGGKGAALRLGRICVAAIATASVLIALHSLSVVTTQAESVGVFTARVATKTLLDTPLFPQVGYLERYVRWQPLSWLLMAAGTLAALRQRRFDVASLALALLPIAIYRNAFPYYYVVMLAPASVLAGFAMQSIPAHLRRSRNGRLVPVLIAVMWLGITYQGLARVSRLSFDDQGAQRAVVSTVHTIFPDPVNYIDRCGMISSFRKVNFFMSTWGMENYLSRNEPFMPQALRDWKPAFVLINASPLSPSRSSNGGLLPEDRRLLDAYYPMYWGPIRVAGSSARLTGAEETVMHVPFAAGYRLQASDAVLIDGKLHRDGDVIQVDAAGISVRAATIAGGPYPLDVKLFLAAAGARPPAIAAGPLFSGL